MNETRKNQQFVEWLCGEEVEFPFFKNLPQVNLPESHPFEESEENER